MIPFPEVLDSSIIADFRACPRRTELAHILHYKPRDLSVHLHAGGAFAKGIETTRRAFFEEGVPAREAEALGMGATMEAYGPFECPPDSPKSLMRTVGALEYYFSQFPIDTDKAIPIRLPSGRRAIEFNGVDPLEVDHPETGNPLLYSWRMDAVVSFDGLTLGCDEKTTSQLGSSWPRKWDLRSQFTGYTWGAGQHGIHLDGFLVRGISILKTKYETMEAITYRPTWQLARWFHQVNRDAARMIRAWEDGYWDFALDNACIEYGGCQFRQACLMNDPRILLEQHFQRRRWDPVTRTETLLEEGEAYVS